VVGGCAVCPVVCCDLFRGKTLTGTTSTANLRLTILIRSGEKYRALSEHRISVRFRVNFVSSVRSGGLFYSYVIGDGVCKY
jgi:hypothetical protein